MLRGVVIRLSGEDGLVLIEKVRQLAVHFPDAGVLDRARHIPYHVD